MGRRPPTAVRLRKIKRELLKSLSKALRLSPASAHFNGMDLKIPLVFGLGSEHLFLREQLWTYRFLARVLQDRPGPFVDIGANVGLYLIWTKSIDESREYIGFEPNPACNFYLQELIRNNGFSDVSVFPVALSDTRRLGTFFARRLGDKMGSLLTDHRTEKDRPFSFRLITEPGDPVFAELNPPSISAMKIDVEGAELEVLRGLSKTLARYGPPLICEVLSPDPHQASFDARMHRLDELLALLRTLDYTALCLGDDGELHPVREAADLSASSHPDRILVPTAEMKSTLELWQKARDADQ